VAGASVAGAFVAAGASVEASVAAGGCVAAGGSVAGAPQAVSANMTTIAKNRNLRIVFFSLKKCSIEQTTSELRIILGRTSFPSQAGYFVYTIIHCR
jgi:hypothetical protein